MLQIPARAMGGCVFLAGGALLIINLGRVTETKPDLTWCWSVIAFGLIGAALPVLVGGKGIPGRALFQLWLGISSLCFLNAFSQFSSYLYSSPAVEATYSAVFQVVGSCLLLIPIVHLRKWAAVLPGTLVSLAAMTFLCLWWQSATRDFTVFAALCIVTVALILILVLARVGRWLQMVNEQEKRARHRDVQPSRADLTQKQQRELSALVHDEVLSTLVAAMQVRGKPSQEVCHSARMSLSVLEDSVGQVQVSRSLSVREAIEAFDYAVLQFRMLRPSYCIEVDDTLRVSGKVVSAMILATREAVRNSLKHAPEGGVQVSVFLSTLGGKVTITDQGPGFEVDQLPNDRMGVRKSLVERMESVHGSATICSQVGNGTAVELLWPRCVRQ